MPWQVRHEGSPRVVRDLSLQQIVDGLRDGLWETTDEVVGPGETRWQAIESHPQLAEIAMDIEDLRPPRHQEATSLDLNALIDISLVLLIFFMMTASVSTGILSTIATPSAQHQLAAITQGSFWVGVDSKNRGGIKGEEGATWYSFGKDIKETVAPTQDLSEVSGALAKELEKAEAGEVKIRIRGDRNLPIETIKSVVVQLQDLENRLNRGRGSGKLTFIILGEVSEPKTAGP